MTTGSFETLGGQITAMICADDPGDLLEFLAFPFTFIEDEFTLVLHTQKDLTELHRLIAPAVRMVDGYVISDTELKPIGAMLYLANFNVNVSFRDGNRLDPSKRVVILAEREGRTKAISGMALLACSIRWLSENDADTLKELQAWAN